MLCPIRGSVFRPMSAHDGGRAGARPHRLVSGSPVLGSGPSATGITQTSMSAVPSSMPPSSEACAALKLGQSLLGFRLPLLLRSQPQLVVHQDQRHFVRPVALSGRHIIERSGAHEVNGVRDLAALRQARDRRRPAGRRCRNTTHNSVAVLPASRLPWRHDVQASDRRPRVQSPVLAACPEHREVSRIGTGRSLGREPSAGKPAGGFHLP